MSARKLTVLYWAWLFVLSTCQPKNTATDQRLSIGSAGGSLSAGSEASVEIPAGALEADTEITLATQEEVAELDNGVAVGRAYHFGPSGLAFKQPVTVILAFDPGLLPDGSVGEDVRVFTAETAAGPFVSIGGRLVDDRHVAAETPHFSVFRAAVLPPQACHGEGTVGRACDDADPCTQDDVCSEGKCTGQAIDCDDHDPCTADACASGGGCQHTPFSGACDDGDACTSGDTCSEGVCAGVPMSCTTPPTACSADTGTCLEGVCTYAPKAPNASCDDNSACTVNDHCVEGSCVGVSGTACLGPENCENGVDDDQDGYTDTADCDCPPTKDLDGDGQVAIRCGGTDCNDGNAAVKSGATELCNNAIDDNCNGQVNEGCILTR